MSQRERRTLTPAVLGSAAFTTACALFAVVFVAARGGLQMPIAAPLPPVAVATDGPTEPPATAPAPTQPPPTAAPTTTAPSPGPTEIPTAEPTPGRTFAIPTLRPNDPLALLPECSDRPGCYVYVIQRGDTLTGIADKFLVGTITILALNPQLADPSVVVTGTALYLGLSPFVRLDPCPNAEPCSLYEVQPGDSVSEIAARYGLRTERVLAANPTMQRPIVVGQVIRLPHPA